MKTKSKIEAALSIFFTFAIVIIYTMIIKPVSDNTERMIIRPLIYFMLLGAPYIVCRVMKIPIGTLGFKKNELLKQILIGIGIFVILALVVTIAVYILGDNKVILLPVKENRIGIIIYSIVFDMLCVGMGEETLFRGYFLERFHTLTDSGVWAVAISALIFGIWHFPNGQDFLQVILAALIGTIYGFTRLKIKNCSTLSVGIAHGLHDVYLLLLAYILL